MDEMKIGDIKNSHSSEKEGTYKHLHLPFFFFFIDFDPFILPFHFLSRPLQITGDLGREEAIQSPRVNEEQGAPLGGLALGARDKTKRISAPTAVPSAGGCWSPLCGAPLCTVAFNMELTAFSLSADSLVSGRPGLPKHKQAHTQACWG